MSDHTVVRLNPKQFPRERTSTFSTPATNDENGATSHAKELPILTNSSKTSPRSTTNTPKSKEEGQYSAPKFKEVDQSSSSKSKEGQHRTIKSEEVGQNSTRPLPGSDHVAETPVTVYYVSQESMHSFFCQPQKLISISSRMI